MTNAERTLRMLKQIQQSEIRHGLAPTPIDLRPSKPQPKYLTSEFRGGKVHRNASRYM